MKSDLRCENVEIRFIYWLCLVNDSRRCEHTVDYFLCVSYSTVIGLWYPTNASCLWCPLISF